MLLLASQILCANAYIHMYRNAVLCLNRWDKTSPKGTYTLTYFKLAISVADVFQNSIIEIKHVEFINGYSSGTRLVTSPNIN